MESCDPYNVPIMIEGCAKTVEVVFHAAASHGARTDAIPPGQFSVPINFGRLGPGPVTLGFQAWVVRSGCGIGGVINNWGGSATVSVTVR